MPHNQVTELLAPLRNSDIEIRMGNAVLRMLFPVSFGEAAI